MYPYVMHVEIHTAELSNERLLDDERRVTAGTLASQSLETHTHSGIDVADCVRHRVIGIDLTRRTLAHMRPDLGERPRATIRVKSCGTRFLIHCYSPS